MQTVSITQLKNSLSAYLRDVKAGEEVLITDRGRPIARLAPVSSSDSMEEHLDEMERKGLLRRGTGRLPDDFWDLPRPADPEGLVRKAISLDRDESW